VAVLSQQCRTDQLRVVDVGDSMCKVRETVPDVLTGRGTRFPETR